jgi:hypothetical protein
VRVTTKTHHESIGVDEGYAWTEYCFDIDGRRYVAEHRLGSGVEVVGPPDRRDDDLEAVADYLMRQDGIRHVYHEHARLRPQRLREPRSLRPEEHALLTHLLTIDDRRVDPLREQARHVLVEDDSGLPFTLLLQVPGGVAPPARELRDQAPIFAHTNRNDDHLVTANVWLDGGYLASIDITWYVHEPPELPRPHQLGPAELV